MNKLLLLPNRTGILVVFLMSVLLCPLRGVVEAKHTILSSSDRRRLNDPPLAGGYSPIKKLDDPMIVEAAGYALQTLQSPSTSPYGFGTSASSFQILEASQQVVAGLNIRLTLSFQDESLDCVGACSVTVYNKFGVLSISQWNKELTCLEAEGLEYGSEGDAN
jgi:hypothetical protein